MSKLFCLSPGLRILERQMQEPPGYRPRGYGICIIEEMDWKSRGNYSEIVDCVISRMQLEHLKKRVEEIFTEVDKELIFRSMKHRNDFYSLLMGKRSKTLQHTPNYAAAVFLLSAYYACEEMQKLFQETANELTEEFGTESVDFAYVEQHTRFTLDGGITFNGVWDSMEWQINRDRAIGGNFHDVNMAPPEDFVYCSNATWDGEAGLDGFKEYFAGKNAESPFKLFLLAAVKNIDAKESLLLNHENYMAASEWEDNDIYQSTMSFLKNFNITWNYESNRFEFLSVK